MGANGTGDYMRRFTAILTEISRWRSKKPLISDNPPTAVIKKPQISSVPTHQEKSLKFSESKAYFGIDKRELLNENVMMASQSTLEAFDAATHKQKIMASFLSSIAVVCFYFWYSRKDYNGFLNAPKYEVVPTLKRYALRQQIKEAQKNGKDTTYLKAALEYVDVEEAIYRAEEGAFTLDS